MYIVGQTGTGKSELAKFLAIQDIKAGNGVAFIDPHGSAVSDILLQVPEERIKDVIYFNPGDEQFPMGFNILDAKGRKAQNMVINSFIELLYKLYDPQHQGIVGPQLERAVRNAMLTVMEVVPGGTMVDVMRLIIDQKYEKELAAKVTDPMVKKYWIDEMANTQAFHRSEKTGYFVSKFDRFVTDRTMRNIMGQSESAFNIADVMKNKKILLVDLNKGLLGEENSKFLGLLIIPKLLTSAFNRPYYEGPNYDDFYLYIDEFQNFATPDLVTILSEARKYKLNLTVANQFLAQMTEDIRNAIFGNVGTLVSFRVGQDDAKYLSEQFAPFYKESDLINQQIGRIIMRLLVDGHPTVPFSLKTDWESITSAPRSQEIANRIIKESQQKYGKPIAEVEKEISIRMGLNNAPASEQNGSQNPFMPFPRSPMPFGMSGQAGGAMPHQPPRPFTSGQTPFSQGQASRANIPFGFGQNAAGQTFYPRNVMPITPYTMPTFNYFRASPVPNKQDSEVSVSPQNPIKPREAENKDAPTSPPQVRPNVNPVPGKLNAQTPYMAPPAYPMPYITYGGGYTGQPVYYNPLYNPRPLQQDLNNNANNTTQNNPKRGAISLANLTSSNSQNTPNKTYSQSRTVFSNTGSTQSPIKTTFNGPLTVENPEKKEKNDPPTKDDVKL